MPTADRLDIRVGVNSCRAGFLLVDGINFGHPPVVVILA